MIVDTSAWIEFSRATPDALHATIVTAVAAGAAATVDVVRLELLAGVGGDARRTVRRVLGSCAFINQVERTDVEHAAELFSLCRRRGETVRSPNDCLIAAIAIRADVPVLHRDRDFDAIARHSSLQAVRR